MAEEPENFAEPETEELEIKEPGIKEPETVEFEDTNEPERGEFPVDEIADKDKSEEISEAEIPPEVEESSLTDEEIKNANDATGSVETLLDEEFFALFSEEVQKVEENDPRMQSEPVLNLKK